MNKQHLMMIGHSKIANAMLKDIRLEYEYKFHPVRRWRFDLAHPETKTAIEIEGGIWTKGRHTRPIGYIKDMEKYNAAIELGWVILRYSTEQMKKSETYEQIKRVIKIRTVTAMDNNRDAAR